jgi:hypothetical protein
LEWCSWSRGWQICWHWFQFEGRPVHFSKRGVRLTKLPQQRCCPEFLFW